RRPRGWLQRRNRLESAGEADWPYPATRGLREHHVRRAQAQPSVHGGEPVALCCVREHARRRAFVNHTALFTMPPSTRSAAPVVADDSGLATYATSDAP